MANFEDAAFNLSPTLVEDAAGNVYNPFSFVPPAASAAAPSSGGFSLDRLLSALQTGAGRVGSGILRGFEQRPVSSTLTALAALAALRGGGSSRPAGYQGGINMALRAQRSQEPRPAYVPYSGQPTMGRRYFTPTTYAAKGGLMSAEGLRSGDFILPADFISDLGNGSSSAGLELAAEYFGAEPIRGPGDGMSDSIATNIDGRQEARVARDEARVPRERVAALGGGDIEAGSKKLYDIMARVRKAAHGTDRQSKKVNPEKFKPGGMAKFADGGSTSVSDNFGGSTTVSNNLSSWAGPYVTDYLSRGQALANTPYEAYTGPLTAGVSPIQQQAFTAAGGYTAPTQFAPASQIATQVGQTQTAPYTAANINTGLGPVGSVESYMSPYTSGVTDVLAREARRESDIGRTAEQARLAQAGAFGGSRQAIMEAERQRNLGTQIGDIRAKGLEGAYDRALRQRLGEAELGVRSQTAAEQSRQFGAELDLRGGTQQLQAAQILGGLGAAESAATTQGLRTLSDIGGTERGIEQEGINAALRQFEQERLFPYQQLQFQQSLMQGLPVDTRSTSEDISSLNEFLGGAGGLAALWHRLSRIEGG